MDPLTKHLLSKLGGAARFPGLGPLSHLLDLVFANELNPNEAMELKRHRSNTSLIRRRKMGKMRVVSRMAIGAISALKAAFTKQNLRLKATAAIAKLGEKGIITGLLTAIGVEIAVETLPALWEAIIDEAELEPEEIRYLQHARGAYIDYEGFLKAIRAEFGLFDNEELILPLVTMMNEQIAHKVGRALSNVVKEAIAEGQPQGTNKP